MLKACFFGASVTRQKISYVESLRRIMPGHDFAHFPFGGMHLSDAGICLMDEFLETDAEVHFLEWFSTGKIYDEPSLTLYLDAICHRLVERGRKPAFLLVPRKDMNPQRLANYRSVRKYAERYGMKVVDVNARAQAEGIHPEQILKDAVHTNQEGADYYAETIMNALAAPSPDPSLPPPNKYISIGFTEFERIVEEAMEIEVEDEVVGMLQTIGPYSGKVVIHREGIAPENINVWDMWCHYERPHFCIPLKGPGHFTVKVSQDPIDKRSCKRIVEEWGQFGPNRLVIHKLFHVGRCRVVRSR
jgi:hypothetical protein